MKDDDEDSSYCRKVTESRKLWSEGAAFAPSIGGCGMAHTTTDGGSRYE